MTLAGDFFWPPDTCLSGLPWPGTTTERDQLGQAIELIQPSMDASAQKTIARPANDLSTDH